MRRLTARVVYRLAALVYEWGCALYGLGDRLDPTVDETNLTEDDLAVMWNNATPTTTVGNTRVTVTSNGVLPK